MVLGRYRVFRNLCDPPLSPGCDQWPALCKLCSSRSWTYAIPKSSDTRLYLFVGSNLALITATIVFLYDIKYASRLSSPRLPHLLLSLLLLISGQGFRMGVGLAAVGTVSSHQTSASRLWKDISLECDQPKKSISLPIPGLRSIETGLGQYSSRF